jgi:hypothetical protein
VVQVGGNPRGVFSAFSPAGGGAYRGRSQVLAPAQITSRLIQQGCLGRAIGSGEYAGVPTPRTRVRSSRLLPSHHSILLYPRDQVLPSIRVICTSMLSSLINAPFHHPRPVVSPAAQPMRSNALRNIPYSFNCKIHAEVSF